MTFEGRRLGVLLAEYPLVLDALERVVRSTGVDVVGKATDVDHALALTEQHEPHILVIDIDMRNAHHDGISLVRRARELIPDLSVVAVSTRKDRDFVRAALAAGVVAYVVKTAQTDDLASAVRQAFEPTLYVPGGVTPVEAAAQPGDASDDTAFATPELTRREREILRLVAHGRSNAQVATALRLTEQTIKVHLSNTYRKLGVSNRTEASRWAQLNGLLDGRAA